MDPSAAALERGTRRTTDCALAKKSRDVSTGLPGRTSVPPRFKVKDKELLCTDGGLCSPTPNPRTSHATMVCFTDLTILMLQLCFTLVPTTGT